MAMCVEGRAHPREGQVGTHTYVQADQRVEHMD